MMSDTTTDHAARIREFCDELRTTSNEHPMSADYRFMRKAANSIEGNVAILAAERDALKAYARRLENGIRSMSETSARTGLPIVLHTKLISDARRDSGVMALMGDD